jgi:hypothetical protein
MKINPIVTKYLRWSIVTLVLGILVSIGIGWGSYEMLISAQRQQKVAVAKMSEMKGKLARASDEEQELRAKILRFQEIAARGLIGPENRLDWVEQIARIRADRKLLDLQYEFSPQHPVDSLTIPSGPSAGGYRFLSSTQQVKLKLLHEGDLLNYIADLRSKIRAHIQIRSCDIERLAPNPVEKGIAANLSANCQLEWISLQEGS